MKKKFHILTDEKFSQNKRERERKKGTEKCRKIGQNYRQNENVAHELNRRLFCCELLQVNNMEILNGCQSIFH